jgi:hypothetical protein
VTRVRHRIAARYPDTVAVIAILAAIFAASVHGEESPVAKITVSASPAGANFGERPVEGVMQFRGRRYLLTLQGVTGSASSVGSVFGLRRPRDITGRYASSGDGLRNESGVTIKFVPPLEIGGGVLRIDLAARMYPKASTGQGGHVE